MSIEHEVLIGEQLSEETLKLLDLAGQAGLVAQKARKRGLEISADADMKGFVTSGDMDVDSLIHTETAVRFPNAAVLSEETKYDFNPRDYTEVLIVDPIDGTRWYKDGGEIWSINLCLVRNGEVVSAVIRQPDLDISTFAEKGVGAFCQKDGAIARIHTSPETELRKIKVGVGINFSSYEQLAKISEVQKQVFLKAKGAVSLESTGYELACLARGMALAAYLHPGAQPWDKAAGMLIINEAGGVATGWPGRDGLYGDGALAGSNPTIYRKIRHLANRYMAETIYDDPEFERKKTAYFQDFMWRHRPQAYMYKQGGLLNEAGSGGWRNVAKHQLLTAVFTETIAELVGLPEEESTRLTNLMLTHDVDKRREQEGLTKEQEIELEFRKSGRPQVATSSNFRDFSDWGIAEYILRYADSSAGDTSGHWYGPRERGSLPDVVILPWRERVQLFKDTKQEEGERGIPVYGMTTWEKLEQMMTKIEADLYSRIIQNNSNLAERYTDHTQLTELIEDRIHEKILSS